MKALTLSSGKVNNDTLVSNIFLDRYMGDSNGEFVKVYLYLLRCLGYREISLSDIADKLNLTEKDVIRALKYWDKQKVLAVNFASANEPESITILPLGEDTIADVQAATISPATEEIATEEVTPQMAAHQAPLSLGFSRQEYWSRLPFPSPVHESEK